MKKALIVIFTMFIFSSVLGFASEIPCSIKRCTTIEINDPWSGSYGQETCEVAAFTVYFSGWKQCYNFAIDNVGTQFIGNYDGQSRAATHVYWWFDSYVAGEPHNGVVTAQNPKQ